MYLLGAAALGAAIFILFHSYGEQDFPWESFLLFGGVGVALLLITFWTRKELDNADYEEYVQEKENKEENIKRRKKKAKDIWEAFKNPAKKK